MAKVMMYSDFHDKALIEKLRSYYKSGYMSDTTLCFEDGKIKGHKLILSAGSPHLERVLSMEEVAGYVYFASVSKKPMDYVIEYIYTGSAEVPADMVTKVMDAAEYFQVKGFIFEEIDNSDQEEKKGANGAPA